MVSFKSNNVSSEQSHRHLPGTLRGSLNHSHNHHHNHPHRHELPPSTYLTPPPPPPASSYITVQRGCALHSRLDQPVTSSTPGMDSKKIVQSSTPPAVPVQVRSKHDGSGVAASVSGVRRRSGPQGGLRSPAAKRPLSAPVALQGWLHKQGSEGLMLWKKRWFVLSEYCLFYYKGPEEEKLLGSILLPSYRVTVCKPEDKVNKKFAFKAEHANMRTYHFAADSRESMNQWVNALTLATLLQDPSPGAGEAAVVIEIAQDGERSARPSVSSISSILNQSADDSDSGFHGFQSRDDPSHASNNNSSPNSANTASFPNLSGSNSNGNSANNNHGSDSGHPMMNGWVQQSPQYGQPGTSQPQQQQQQQQQQYEHLLPSQQLQPHPHQALLHYHLPHQNALPTHQSSQLHKHVVQQSPQQQQQQQQPQQISHPGTGSVQTIQPMPRTKFGQPIYANAPPKPRRLTDGSNEYSTPSPDMDYRKSPVSPDVTVTSKSPMSDYERNNTIYGTRMNQPSQQSLRIDKSGLHYGYGQTTQSTERRTPDTYGRSAKPRTSSRGNGDYEEVYGTPQLYQRPAGPVGYTKGASPAPIPIPVYAQQQHLQQLHSPVITPPNMAIVRQSRTQPPPRPHSADFLEYEAARRPQQQPTQCERPPDQQRRPQRPKSSLDIVNPSDTTNDGYFYSEERYAAQMRQSAVYLHQTPQHYQQQRNQSLSRVTMQPKLPGIRDKTDENRISTLSDSTCPALRRVQRDHVHQQHTIPAQSLTQRHSEIMGADPKLRRSLREKSCEANGRETLTHGEDNTIPRRIPRGEYDGWGRAAGHVVHGTHIAQTCHAGHAGASRRWSEQQQFCRSASARLPRTRHPAALDPDDDDYAERSSEQDSRDGERKIQQREESMKRLLEWKQRMLQSPLTRKPSGSANRGRTQNDLSSYYKQQALLDLAAHEAAVAEGRHSRRREDGHRSHVRSKSSDGRRTAVNVPRYNSYSSDDEELGDIRRKRSRRPTHAGRSPRHAGDDRSSTATSAVQDVTIPGTGRTSVNQTPQSQILNSRKANPGSTLSSLGGIPPDAGYDEVSFPPMMRNDYAYASSSTDKQSLSRRSDPETAFEDPARHKTPKKPLGILKSSTAYGFDQQKYDGQQTSMIENNRADNLCGYQTNVESWHVQKNVQWDSKDDNDEWDPGIDESKVIKEFSYQYINPKKVPVPSTKTEDESEKFETMNLVQCRIRSFEMNMDGASPVKEVLTMQEPLKVSPLQATEAHVSKLDCANKTSSVIRSFALGDTNASENASKQKSVEEGHAKQASTDSNKSVKDLLADFERKSQQANRPKSEKRQESKHRGDYGDNETLRYDIGSNLDRLDRDDGKEKFIEKNEDITQHFTLDTLYTDAVQMQNSDESLKQNKMNSSKDSLTEQCVPSTDLNVIPSPSCTRTSITESLLTHSDQFSTDNDIISKQDDINSEDHYLPMSPRKAILDPNSDDRPHPKMMESLFADEESSYVEMAQNGMTRSLLAPNEDGRKHDSGDYSTLDPSSHYEFVCVRDNKMEPVYMEVNQLSEKEDEDGSKASSMKKSSASENSPHSRGDLPDILTALKSDSSDADDESSKDLESIDAPRHPRFSLSDTFRPASYYLGASRNMMAELHDSSDSELVSPPPIPTSPPPLDDLESLDMQESLEIKKVSPQVATMKDNALNRDSPKSWNKPVGQMETHRPPSRFSDATISSTFRDSRISLESASGSDSIELRNPEEEARHRQLKRRPVSDDVCEVLDSLDELESLGSRFDGASIDLDQYLEELQARDAFNVDLYAKDPSYNSIYGFNENMLVVDKLQKTTCQDLSRKMKLMSSNLDRPFDYSGKNKTGSASSLPSMRVSDLPPTHQHSQSFTGDAHYENVASFSPLRGSPAVRSDSEPPRTDHRMQSTSQSISALPISHSRDSSYSNASAAASISTSMACQRPASAQSSMHSPISASMSSVNHGSTLTSMLQNVNAYSEQRFPNHSRSASHDACRVRHALPNHRSTSSQDSSHYPDPMSMQTINSVLQQSYLPNAGEQRVQSDQSGAPYYYSDLQASVNSVDMELTKPMIGHTSRLPQLNNQRDDAAIGLNKRNDIGRIVNPIARQMPRQIQVDDIDEARRIAAELRRTTCQLLGDNKAALVDKRNFYEADTLRRVKSTDPLPDVSLPEARNLYPHGLRDKSVNPGNADNTEPTHVTQASHRRSRSLEGLLDDVGLQNLVEQRNRANRAAAATTTTAIAVTSMAPTSQVETTSQNLPSSDHNHNAMTDSSFNSEDPWEQDSLWCESLRRVSLRNARSLDNLDSPPRPGRSGGLRSPKSRGKITRGATYVNDSVVLRRDNCTEESSCGERPRVKRRTNKDHRTRERSIEDDDDVTYETLSMEMIGTGGYVWDPQSNTYHKPTLSDRNHFLEDGNLPPARSIPDARMSATSFELDREKLRQWDLLSSACLLQEQQRTSMADSGRGLPVVEQPGDAHDSQLAVVTAATTTMTTTDAMTTAVMTMTATPTMTTTTTTTTTMTTTTTIMTMNTAIDNEQVDVKPVIVKPVDIADVRDALPMKMPIKRQEPRQGPCKRAAASGSGSVIGRDPLPPRAVSTSHLPQRTLTQPPTAVSTLPLPRNTTGSNHRQQPLPLHHSTPQQQQQQQSPMRQLENESTAHILRAASNGDIGKCPGMVTGNDMRDLRLASPSGHSTQRLISPIGHLRVTSLNDHRVSSPSDSEIRVHSPSERKMMSPIGREVDRGGGTMTGPRQGQQRPRTDCNELLHKRSNIGSLRADASGRLVTQAGASGLVRVSAGELLGRTHEELVLLLIQLRRQNATVLKAMETCHMEIEAQARLADLDTPRRLENLQKLEELKRHLMDLEKQYEKSKPLVNLVDNMVKLGSLYNRNTANGTSNVSGSRHDLHENARDHRDRLEFNQRVQEQRLLAEERRDWDRLSPDHGQLQAKVQQLYKLDRLLQEESGTLHSLQQDKEILEKALGGLRHKLQGSRSNLAEAERYRKQQLLLERELSRVRILLAHNSKKLEETVAENARLEQDLVVLRQKVQASRRYAGNVARDTSSTTAPLEAELRRVQQLVGDLQRQRKELSVQVRQLTEKSHSLVQQIRPQPPHAPQVHHSKKRTQNSWLETDLDSGITLDHGLDSPSSPSLSISPPNKQNDSSHQRYGSPTQYKDLSPLNRPHNQQSFVQPSQNHISTLSPQLREQIQQHQLKQQLLKDQMQGKGNAIQVVPLYVNTDSRVAGDYVADTSKHNGNIMNGTLNPAPEYIPPPPPPLSEEALLLNDNYRQNEDNKFAGLMHNREKQEIKTVRIVKRESERRQRDRGDRTGNLGIPLTNGLQAPGGAKRLSDDDFGGSQKFEKAQLGRVVEESPIVHAQSTVQLSELDDVQFQRSMSLPRGFGGQKQQTGVHYGPVVPPPRSDSMHALKSMMARRHKIRFESHDGSSDSTLSPYTDSPTSSSHMPMSSPNYSTASSYSPCQSQNYPSQATMVAAQSHYNNYSIGPYKQYEKIGTLAGAMSPELTSPTNVGIHERPTTATTANTNQSDSPQLSPVFKSEAAKQIIKEMTEKRVEGPRRRQIPREKRRHYTVSSSKPVLDLEDTFSKMGMGRARDDLDMERALRPRINAPDVVRSTLSHKELKYNESTIDQLLGTPNKIVIPERYIPEQTPELTAEEQEQRLKKAEAIRKMLSETTVTAPEGGDDDSNIEKSDTLKRKVVEEKRQREHILQLNQILAKQVMEKSKMVAVKALATLPLKTESSLDDEDLSPVAPLPLYQQRENFYS
ncbi:PREDICTED: uncharacterized protein LOC108755157 isoform X2 [Trachymyrmex septentrionalis]|uniref:uncharacterized protein LOC108755157 isoform X2 n=1 Tax=Trachymyrmex septentrionalis TaxID=34720 RepID=UPI00084F1723|nr:PREDICTED: uncharacterized protein LOC108755157 isoform X2 [Trachymyrmex septentrionalis]